MARDSLATKPRFLVTYLGFVAVVLVNAPETVHIPKKSRIRVVIIVCCHIYHPGKMKERTKEESISDKKQNRQPGNAYDDWDNRSISKLLRWPVTWDQSGKGS